MDFITDLFDLDLSQLVPEMSQVLDKARLAVTASVLAGPILLLILGVIYFFIPPREANHRFGFRTYFGMGSVEAWRFTQKVAGLLYSLLGLTFLIIMLVVIKDFDTMDHFTMVMTAMKYLLWQAGFALLMRLLTGLLAMIFFNGYGNRRWKKKI